MFIVCWLSVFVVHYYSVQNNLWNIGWYTVRIWKVCMDRRGIIWTLYWLINQPLLSVYWNFNQTLFPYKFNMPWQCFSPENVPCQAVISHSGIAANILEYEQSDQQVINILQCYCACCFVWEMAIGKISSLWVV